MDNLTQTLPGSIDFPPDVAGRLVEEPDGDISIKEKSESTAAGPTAGSADDPSKTAKEAGTSEKTTAAGAEKTDKPAASKEQQQEKPGEKKDGEGQPEKGIEDDEVFLGRATDSIKAIVSQMTKEQREKLLEDLPNHPKFLASLTQKAQAQKEEAALVKALSEKMNSEGLVAVLKEFAELPDRELFLENMDDWFGGKENNIVRKLLGALEKAQPAAAEHAANEDRLAKDKAEIRLREEIVNLKSVKDSPFDYSNEAEIDATFEFADRYYREKGIFVDLATAHTLRAAESFPATIKAKNDEIASLKNELKARSEEVKALMAGKTVVPPDASKNGKTSTRETYDKPPANEAELDSRMSRRFDELQAEGE